jgi:two-component system CheB/CheR fusion protein
MAARNEFLIVGVGASAGGVDAFEHLFRPMPTDTGMAFVLMTHLSRHHESALPAIVGRYTAMPVVSVSDGVAVEPNHVYVCPPGQIMTVEKGRLRLRECLAADTKPIDVFLSSLAKDRGAAAVGIVLSGSGNDGTLGIKAIKEQGGLTLAQGSDGKGPMQSGMPNSAIAAGVVDLALPVEEMPGRLADLADRASLCAGKLYCLSNNGGEHGFQIERRVHRLADLAQRLQLVNGAGQLVCPRSQFVEQSDIFNRNHCLVGEGLS